MAPSRSTISLSSLTCGSSEKLPLVITAGPSSSRISNRCSGVVGSMKPSVASPGATASGRSSGPAAGSSTIGAAAPVKARSASQSTTQ
jgi:hypothetical protein